MTSYSYEAFPILSWFFLVTANSLVLAVLAWFWIVVEDKYKKVNRRPLFYFTKPKTRAFNLLLKAWSCYTNRTETEKKKCRYNQKKKKGFSQKKKKLYELEESFEEGQGD